MTSLLSMFCSERGNVGVLFALSAVPLVAGLGGAVDLAMQSRVQSEVQAGLDAAALAAARTVAEQTLANGKDYIDYGRAERRAGQVFNAAIAPLALEAELSFSYNGTRVITSLAASIPTSFLPLVGIGALPVNGYAEADFELLTETCVYVTAPKEQGITLEASSEFRADCGVRVESTNPRAISATASSDMHAHEICSNGDTFLWARSTVTPSPSPCRDDYLDPLRHIMPPSQANAGCDFVDHTVKGHVSLPPGVYCGTTTIAPSSHAVLEAGEFIFRDGELRIGSGSSAFGEDILLYFAGRESGLNVGDGSRFEGHGRSAGEYAGLLVFVDRDCLKCANVVHAGGTATVEGTFYAPAAPFTVQSRASTVSAGHALFIVYQLIQKSSASFTVMRDDGSGKVPKAYIDAVSLRVVK